MLCRLPTYNVGCHPQPRHFSSAMLCHQRKNCSVRQYAEPPGTKGEIAPRPRARADLNDTVSRAKSFAQKFSNSCDGKVVQFDQDVRRLETSDDCWIQQRGLEAFGVTEYQCGVLSRLQFVIQRLR